MYLRHSFSVHSVISSELGAKYFAGYQPFINLTVGGQKRSGGDACNDLTYLIMDAVRFVKVYQPSLACRIHNQSPQKYMEKIVDVVKAGMGFPACHFDDSHIKMMLRKGFDFEDARDYCLMGCVEPQKSGRIYQWTSTGYTQWPIAIEFVLNRGRVLMVSSSSRTQRQAMSGEKAPARGLPHGWPTISSSS